LVLALSQAAILLWRRWRPLHVTAIVVALYAGTVAVAGETPPLGPWVMVWTLATTLTGRGRASQAAAFATLAVIVILFLGDLAREGSGAAAFLSGVSIVVCLSGVLVRSERGRVESTRSATAAEERLRIARDLHDLVGHGLGAVAVQSSTARLALDAGDVVTARTALAAVESSSRTAMREMRQLLGVVTNEEASAAESPAPGLDDIPALVDNIRVGGVVVTWETDVDASTVSAPVQLCAYRVVQEALTNAFKHSPGGMVAASLRRVASDRQHERDCLRLRVETTGGTTTDTSFQESGGSGIAGIHTRVRSVGGIADIGETADGWLVEAVLPLEPREAT